MGALDGWEAVVPCHSFVIPSALPRRFRTECILRVSNVPFLEYAGCSGDNFENVFRPAPNDRSSFSAIKSRTVRPIDLRSVN